MVKSKYQLLNNIYCHEPHFDAVATAAIKENLNHRVAELKCYIYVDQTKSVVHDFQCLNTFKIALYHFHFEFSLDATSTNNAITCVKAKSIYVNRISVNISNFIRIECKQTMFLRAHRKKRMCKTQMPNIRIQNIMHTIYNTNIHVWIELAWMIYAICNKWQCMKRVERFAITFQIFVWRMVYIAFCILYTSLAIIYSTFYEIVLYNSE